MRRDNRDRNQRILIGILAIAVLSLVVVSYLNHRVSNKTESFLEGEKRLLEQELEKMAEDYDSLKMESSGFSEQLSENRVRLDRLLDSVKTSESNYSLLIEYRRKLRSLRSENKRLMEFADSLSEVNQGLTRRIKEQDNALNQKSNGSKNSTPEEKVTIAINELQAKTLRLRDGKLQENDLADKANRLSVSFLMRTKGFSRQDYLKNLYVQVLDPQNRVIGDRQAIVRDDDRLFYTKTSEIVWNDTFTETDIMLAIKDLQQGVYFVNIFHDFRLISSTSFELK